MHKLMNGYKITEIIQLHNSLQNNTGEYLRIEIVLLNFSKISVYRSLIDTALILDNTTIIIIKAYNLS